MNDKLAEICGIIIGDGHLSRYRSTKRTDYKISVFGHKKDDLDYFLELQDLFHKELGKRPIIKCRSRCIELRICSKEILEVFETIGIPVGSKSKVGIPKEIKNNIKLSLALIRGVADTDFSLVFRKRKTKEQYPRITADMKSKILINEIHQILKSIGIKIAGPYIRNRTRNTSQYTTYQIDINGHENFNKWMSNIGFRNPKHIKKVEGGLKRVPPS